MTDTYPIDIIGVRRYGEDDVTPVVLAGRRGCGTLRDHYRNGCIGIEISSRNGCGMLHLTTEDALRLSDLLRALASTDPDPDLPARIPEE